MRKTYLDFSIGKIGKISFWIVLYAAFVAWGFGFAAWLSACEGGTGEFWGWDYATFVRQFGDWSWIGYFGFRHPGLGIVCSPIVALQHVWEGSYLLVLAGIATGTAALIWRMSGWIGLIVWLALPTTWFMAAIPESFPVAQLCLVASAFYFSRVEVEKWRKRDLAVVAGLSGLNAAVTLTNGLKPVLAYLAGSDNKRRKLVLVAVLGGAALLGAALFYVRTLVTGRGCSAGIAMTLSWIPAERHWLTEAYGFFIRPVGIVQSVFVYPLAVWGVVRMVRSRNWSVLRVLVPMFAVEFGIHWLVGWGMNEPWVFAPHWVWMLPIVIGKGFEQKLAVKRCDEDRYAVRRIPRGRSPSREAVARGVSKETRRWEIKSLRAFVLRVSPKALWGRSATR